MIFHSCQNEVREINPEKENVAPTKEVEKEAVDFFESGKPKAFNFTQLVDGKKVITGYEEIHENGAVKIQGNLSPEGQRIGLWESFYEDGKPWSIGNYSNGIENGMKKTWYPDGSPRYEGNLLNGKPTGEWTFWDEKGAKTTKEYK